MYNKKGKKMNIEKLIKNINKITSPKLLRFVSEKGKNSCDDCQKYHNQIFEENDQNMPKIPVHPNCRCKYKRLSANDIENIKKEMMQERNKLIENGNKIAEQSKKLITQVVNLPKGKEQTKSAIVQENISLIFLALQIAFWTMRKLDEANNALQEKIKIAGVDTAVDEFKSWSDPLEKIENILKNWHYNRLNNPKQQVLALPKTPKEAIERGFVKASDKQNLYHRNKSQKDNVKFYNSKTGQEVIFNSKGEIVTDIANIGTYNYFSPDGPEGILHVLVDVLPYYKCGNSKNDTTSLGNRILGAENGPILDLCLTIINLISAFEKKHFKLLR